MYFRREERGGNMSENTENEMIFRCPICFNSGIDVYLKQEDKKYRCLKCSFTGTKQDIEAMYDDFRKRYRLLGKRLTLEEQRNL